MKLTPANAEEVPDDEPLSAEEQARLRQQGAVSRAGLVHRSALAGLTPAEMLSRGGAYAEFPERYEDDRTLPAASSRPSVSASSSPTEVVLRALEDEFWNELRAVDPGNLVFYSAEGVPVFSEDLYAADDEIIDAEIVDG
jgi:hypothetical protein